MPIEFGEPNTDKLQLKMSRNLLEMEVVPDAMILNAGIGGTFNVFDIDVEKFKQIYEVNLFSTLYFLLEREKTEIHFPFRMSLIAKVVKLLPDNFYAKIMQGRK